MRTNRIFLLSCALAVTMVAAFASGVQVPVTREGLFCDEPEQLADLMRLVDKSMSNEQTALSQVNALYEGKHVCGRLQAEFFTIRRLASMETARGTFSLMQVVVVGWWQDKRIKRGFASLQYAAFLEKGEI